MALGLGLPQVIHDGEQPPQNLCLHSCSSQKVFLNPFNSLTSHPGNCHCKCVQATCQTLGLVPPAD